MPRPGTDGADRARHGARDRRREGLYDAEWFGDLGQRARWRSSGRTSLSDKTPEWAEAVSSVPAADIARIAREFAAAAPRATTMCNRGSSAHVNGYFNDRAIILLNGLVGSGRQGGRLVLDVDRRHGQEALSACRPSPRRPRRTSILADPPEFILANTWNTMKVGEIVYWYLQAGARAHPGLHDLQPGLAADLARDGRHAQRPAATRTRSASTSVSTRSTTRPRRSPTSCCRGRRSWSAGSSTRAVRTT